MVAIRALFQGLDSVCGLEDSWRTVTMRKCELLLGLLAKWACCGGMQKLTVQAGRASLRR